MRVPSTGRHSVLTRLRSRVMRNLLHERSLSPRSPARLSLGMPDNESLLNTPYIGPV